MRLSQKKFDQLLEENAGYCTSCCEVTTDDIEPEANGESCTECCGMTVMGMERALMYEEVFIGEDEDEEDIGIISLSEDD